MQLPDPWIEASGIHSPAPEVVALLVGQLCRVLGVIPGGVVTEPLQQLSDIEYLPAKETKGGFCFLP